MYSFVCVREMQRKQEREKRERERGREREQEREREARTHAVLIAVTYHKFSKVIAIVSILYKATMYRVLSRNGYAPSALTLIRLIAAAVRLLHHICTYTHIRMDVLYIYI